MTALQQIIKEAKSIRRKYPKKEWKECVAQASAIYAAKHKGKSPVGKKKKIGYSINKTVFVDPMESGKKRKKKTNKYSVKRNATGEFVKFKKIGAVNKAIPESKVLHEIEKVKHDIKTLESLQKQHMMKKHKSSIGATIRKKHSEIKKLLRKY